MKSLLNPKYREFLQNHKERVFRIGLLTLPGAYLIITFFRLLLCDQGLSVCSLSNYGAAFPFYVLVMPFVTSLNFFSYCLLYIFSAVVYLVIFNRFGNWLLQKYHNSKYRPDFTLKRI